MFDIVFVWHWHLFICTHVIIITTEVFIFKVCIWISKARLYGNTSCSKKRNSARYACKKPTIVAHAAMKQLHR